MLRIVGSLLTLLIKPLIALVVYIHGKRQGEKEVIAKVTKAALDKEIKDNAIEENNLTKSDVIILAELRKRDTRKEP